MYNAELARAVLEKLIEIFPEGIHFPKLKSMLPTFSHIPEQDWLVTIEALRVNRSVTGVFLPPKGPIATVGSLRITELGRSQLHELPSSGSMGRTTEAPAISDPDSTFPTNLDESDGSIGAGTDPDFPRAPETTDEEICAINARLVVCFSEAIALLKQSTDESMAKRVAGDLFEALVDELQVQVKTTDHIGLFSRICDFAQREAEFVFFDWEDARDEILLRRVGSVQRFMEDVAFHFNNRVATDVPPEFSSLDAAHLDEPGDPLGGGGELTTGTPEQHGINDNRATRRGAERAPKEPNIGQVPVIEQHGVDALAGAQEDRTPEAQVNRAAARSAWLDEQLQQHGWTSDLDVALARGPAYNTIKRYRSGARSTRDRYVRQLLAKACACDISAVPE